MLPGVKGGREHTRGRWICLSVTGVKTRTPDIFVKFERGDLKTRRVDRKWLMNSQSRLNNTLMWKESTRLRRARSSGGQGLVVTSGLTSTDVRPQVTWRSWRNCEKYNSLKVCLIHFKFCAPSSFQVPSKTGYVTYITFLFFSSENFIWRKTWREAVLVKGRGCCDLLSL